MPFIPLESVAAFAHRAGFSGDGLITITAIAVPESGQHTEAHNNNAKTGDDSYGLWQINMRGALGPERRQQFGIADNTQLYNPLVNALAAFKLSNGGKDFTPWTTYKDGAYKASVGPATRAVAKLQSDGTTVENQIVGTANDLAQKGDSTTNGSATGTSWSSIISGPFDAFTNKIQDLTWEVGAFIFAVVFIVLGVILLMHNDIGKTVATVAKVLP